MGSRDDQPADPEPLGFDPVPTEDLSPEVQRPTIQGLGIAFEPVPSDWPLDWDAGGDAPGVRRRLRAKSAAAARARRTEARQTSRRESEAEARARRLREAFGQTSGR